MNNTIMDVEIITVESKIVDALAESNVTEMVIAGLRDNYLPLTINGQDDREGYKAVVEARKECKMWRIRASKVCKEGREDAITIQKAWVAKEKEVIGKISEVEDHLQTLEDDYNSEKERIKAEIKAKHDAQQTNRTIELTKYGATFDGVCFVSEDVSYESVLIREADEDIYSTIILPKFKAIFENNEAIKLEQERIKKAEEELLNKQREEIERQQLELKQKQDEINRQQQLIKDEEDRKDRDRLAEEKRIIDAETERLRKIEWEKEMAIVVKKAEEDAANKERHRIEEEQKQAEVKRLQEEQLKAEELAKASDKEKWALFIKQLEDISMPIFKSSYFKKKLAMAKEKIEEIINL